MRVRWKWVVLWSLWAARLVRQPTTPLRVAGGLARGAVAPVGSHRHYLALPYATVHHRFQNPQPAPKWSGVMDFYNEHIRCTQRISGSIISGREDCLTLNVYTPLHAGDAPRPVMVFFHGGGFRDGSASPFLYGPDYLVRHDIVLVTVNYRLEILGFLCLGITEAPGNAGLKDQVEALKWVQVNIGAFGGDPDNVTIFGESAGSASVLYHLVSPMSKGLFHKAIMQSGSAISPWSLQFEPLKIASLFAKHMGYDTEDPKQIVNIFKSKSAEDLLKTRIPRAEGDVVLSENVFVPCVEKELHGIELFLPDTPFNLISKEQYHKVPVIIGYNNAEGYMFVGKENDTTIANFDFYKALPKDLVFPSEAERIETAKQIKQLYMGDEEVSKETLVTFSRFEGESGITFPVVATTELLLSTNDQPVYAYRFCHDGWLNLLKLIFGFWGAPGATHADDLFYIFKPKIPLPQSFLETKMINMVTAMWTNFAKYGNPTTPEETTLLSINWKPTNKTNPHLLVIDKELSTAPLWDSDTIRFWNTTYSKFRRKT